MTYETNSPAALFQLRNRRLLLIAGGLLVLAVTAVAVIAFSRSTPIFPITINGKIGYINASGQSRHSAAVS